MTLIDMSRAEHLYGAMGPATEVSGGSCANTMAGLASLGGSGGFIGKLYILRAAVSAGYPGLAVALVLASLISYFYYLRIVVLMYMRPAQEENLGELTVPGPLRFAVTFAAAGVLVLFFYSAPFLGAAQESVVGLFSASGAFFGMSP